jgi:hypothetical protein
VRTRASGITAGASGAIGKVSSSTSASPGNEQPGPEGARGCHRNGAHIGRIATAAGLELTSEPTAVEPVAGNLYIEHLTRCDR